MTEHTRDNAGCCKTSTATGSTSSSPCSRQVIITTALGIHPDPSAVFGHTQFYQVCVNDRLSLAGSGSKFRALTYYVHSIRKLPARLELDPHSKQPLGRFR